MARNEDYKKLCLSHLEERRSQKELSLALAFSIKRIFVKQTDELTTVTSLTGRFLFGLIKYQEEK